MVIVFGAFTLALIGLAKMIFDKRQTVFKNNILGKSLCNQALVLLFTGIPILWYLLVRHINGEPLTIDIIGLAGIIFLAVAIFWTYKCLRNSWRLIKFVRTERVSIKMKIAIYLTIIFIFGTLCFLWIKIVIILPSKIILLFQ
ncbi:MAG: hypothetical protein NTZ42_01075 [Candidatus Gribaldobacteria bacterium]|nr:hypothetical protein [Candidatus Gribaldobacteria bacterium]